MKQMPALLARVRKDGFLLMLDFDGVLAPLVVRHDRARMLPHTRHLLAACARRGRIVVISGRSLSDVRSRVGLASVWYAGNHGAEWRMGKARGREKTSRAADAKLREARNAFIELSRRYSSVIVEDKKLTFSVHFRSLARSLVTQFRKDAERVAKRFRRVLDIAEGNEHIFNIRSHTSRTKGDAVRLARRCAPTKAVPIYIGDDMTDEDAFGALLRGITIRVGKHRGSAAHLFVRTREDVDTILSLLADH